MSCTSVVLLFMLIAVVGGTVMAGEAMRAVDRGVGRYQRDGGRSRGVEQRGGDISRSRGGRMENENVQRCFNSSSLCNDVRNPHCVAWLHYRNFKELGFPPFLPLPSRRTKSMQLPNTHSSPPRAPLLLVILLLLLRILLLLLILNLFYSSFWCDFPGESY